MATKRTTKKAETMAAKKAAKNAAEVKATAAAEVKTEPVKAEAVKTPVAETAKAVEETVKAAAETVKEAIKETAKTTKAAAKSATKTAAPKAEAKKPARRTTKKAAVVAEEIFVQYNGKEYTTKDVVANIKKAWIEMTGKKEEDIQDIKVYVKPEENKAYYVVNGEVEGHYVEL